MISGVNAGGKSNYVDWLGAFDWSGLIGLASGLEGPECVGGGLGQGNDDPHGRCLASMRDLSSGLTIVAMES